MGCSESRIEKADNQNKQSGKPQASDNCLDLKHYINAEVSLNIHNFPSEKLVRTLQRYSYSKEITEENLSKAFKVLGINLEPAAEFYNEFKLESIYHRQAVMYNAQKICSFFILFGRCQSIEKPSLMFKNYDLSNKNILTQEEITIMIQDILWIILTAIPIFALKQNPKSAVLTMQLESFRKARPEILLEFKFRLVHRSQKILTFKEFSEKASGVDFMKIFKSFDLRKYALKRQNFVITPKDLKKFNKQTTEETTGNSAVETNKDVKGEVESRQNSHRGSFESVTKVKNKKNLKN